MGEANRRRRDAEQMGRKLNQADDHVEVKADKAEIYDGIAAYLLEQSIDRTVLLGPVSWIESDKPPGRRWYFVAIVGDKAGQARLDELAAEDEVDTVEMRAGVMTALTCLNPCVVMDLDDELELARAAEGLWPCAKIKRVREGIQAERERRNA